MQLEDPIENTILMNKRTLFLAILMMFSKESLLIIVDIDSTILK